MCRTCENTFRRESVDSLQIDQTCTVSTQKNFYVQCFYSRLLFLGSVLLVLALCNNDDLDTGRSEVWSRTREAKPSLVSRQQRHNKVNLLCAVCMLMAVVCGIVCACYNGTSMKRVCLCHRRKHANRQWMDIGGVFLNRHCEVDVWWMPRAWSSICAWLWLLLACWSVVVAAMWCGSACFRIEVWFRRPPRESRSVDVYLIYLMLNMLGETCFHFWFFTHCWDMLMLLDLLLPPPHQHISGEAASWIPRFTWTTDSQFMNCSVARCWHVPTHEAVSIAFTDTLPFC